MVTARGGWFLLIVVTLLALALWGNQSAVALVSLTLLLWFLGTWAVFVVRLRLVHGRLRAVRQLCDARRPVESLWAGRTFTVHVGLHCDGPCATPYLRLNDRVPFGVRRIEGQPATDGTAAPDRPLEVTYQIECPTPGRVRFEGLRVEFADLQGFF